MESNYLFLIFLVCCVSNSYQYVNEYHDLAGTHYELKLYKRRATVEAARQICAKDNATLFYPENEYEAFSVGAVYKYVGGGDFKGTLVAYKRSGNDYVSIDTGVSITKMYQGWKGGKPEHDKGACVFMGAEEFDVWLENIPCFQEEPFLCKRPYQLYDPAKMVREDKEVDNISTKRGVKLINYQYVPGTHYYYKLHTKRNTFEAAKSVCEQESATLYYPETEYEAKAVAVFWENVPHVYFPQGAFIGYKRSGDDFKAIDNDDSISKYFSNWRVGEPNNADSKEDCIGMTFAGDNVWYNDIPCSNKESFICKTPVIANLPKPPASDAASTEYLSSEDFYFYHYIPGTNYFYKLVETPSELNLAKTVCESEGASLFYPEDEKEAKTVVGFWNAKRNGGLPDTTVVGLQRIDNDFKTVDTNVSITAIFNTWAPGEPNNAHGAEYCVTLTHKNGEEIHLNDVPCYKKGVFICKTPFDLTQTAVCEGKAKPEGYHYIPGTNSHYKLYTESQTLDAAIEICEREGATVFYAESNEEAKAVSSFWLTLPKTKFPSGCIQGLRRSGEDFISYDTDISISKLFHDWRRYEPNNHDKNENCVSMSRDDGKPKLNDLPCSVKDSFICKIKGNAYQTNAPCGGESNSDIPNGYYSIPETNSTYKLYTTPATLDEAIKICERENATVFSPKDDHEANTVVTFWQAFNGEFPSGAILGYRRSGQDFLNVDTGTSISKLYHKWWRGEPNDANGVESCVAMFYKNRRVWLNDIPCSNKDSFICKMKPQEPAANPANLQMCNQPNSDYGYTEHKGKFYKLHLWPETWEDARDKCKEEGTDLAILNSDEEAAFVVQLINSKPKNRIPGRFLRRAIYLGFYRNDYDTWQTIEGDLLTNSGYTNWSADQPDGGDRMLCGTIFFNGELNDVGCNKKALFVCESLNCK